MYIFLDPTNDKIGARKAKPKDSPEKPRYCGHPYKITYTALKYANHQIR